MPIVYSIYVKGETSNKFDVALVDKSGKVLRFYPREEALSYAKLVGLRSDFVIRQNN